MYPYLESKNLDPPEIGFIYENLKDHYYWSNDWSIDFYTRLCLRGFIAVADRKFLIPEIQREYCILDFDNLKVEKNVRKKAHLYTLSFNSNFKGVCQGLDTHHPNNWLRSKYQQMLESMLPDGHLIPDSTVKATFRPISVELYDLEGNLAAGELGFTIGATYTSLTGFYDSQTLVDGRQRYSSAGKVQLTALAKVLQSCGYSFWNLGHPPQRHAMQYKAHLGGHVLPRAAFLDRWHAACKGSPIRELGSVAPVPAQDTLQLQS